LSLLSAPRGRIVAETALVLLLALSLLAWFAAFPSRALSAPVALLAFLGAVGCAWSAGRPWPRPHASAETAVVMAAALLFRLPALLHPWGWVNTDGAYGSFVALRILRGVRPAPVFTIGANYQGTLKGHLAALFSFLTGAEDLSLMLVVASVVLDLVFIVATMSLARRLAGRPAALAAGLYLALGPKFLTVFSLNSVGQYVDVLALGGAALALVPPLLQDEPSPRERLRALAVGLLLGAAFWQQPVALCYAIAVCAALVLRRGPGLARRWIWLLAGMLVGALPVLIWNVAHGWASGAVLSPDGPGLRAQIEALPYLVRRTADTSLPVLAGVSPGHPWLVVGRVVRFVAGLLIPAALLAFLILRQRDLVTSVRLGRPSPALLPPLLLAACLLLVWATASGAVYGRPRYLLPIMAASAVHLGVVWSAAWSRARVGAALSLAALLALNVAGMWSRLSDGGPTSEYYRSVLRSLETKGVRTGYSDFSLAAPLTMFTRERILLSSRLGPTPAYEPEEQTARVEREGPDAYVLRPDDDPERFAAVLRALGVTYKVDLDPIPVFYGFSRPVRVEEVHGFRGEGTAAFPDRSRAVPARS
jgi:hypothetical protein